MSQSEQDIRPLERTAGRATPQEKKEGRLVRVEANFLRLPLFALDSKQLRTMNGIRCEGTFRKAGQSFNFFFTATRNTRTYYPGPMARSAHLALLSLATDMGLPLQNPIVFSWREICQRMGIDYGGRTAAQVKQSLIAIKGLMIEGKYALLTKKRGGETEFLEEHTRVVNLYDEIEFFGAKKADGTIADVNAVWLSRWYLDNLNALYSGPLDYRLWRTLNEKSPIASRLYEFLFFKFYAGYETLTFNYSNLVKFIPSSVQRYYSLAVQQLGPAFALLQEAGIVREVRWSKHPKDTAQLAIVRGPLLDPNTPKSKQQGFDVGEEDFVLQEIKNLPSPGFQVAEEFHRLWGNGHYRPMKGEIAFAEEQSKRFGKDKLLKMLPGVVKRMKAKWPDAKTFSAAARYLDDAVVEIEREQHRLAKDREEQEKQKAEQREAVKMAERKAKLKLLWEQLEESEREEIRENVLSTQPEIVRKRTAIIERFCIDELGKRKGI